LRKVIVTGARGYLGSRLAEAFAKRGADIRALDRAGELPIHRERLRYYRCDLEKNVFPADDDLGGADLLLHFAWDGAHPERRGDYGLQMKNIHALINTLSFARRCNVSKIIIPGSASEYAASVMPINGNNAPGAVDGYGAAKAACHAVARAWAAQNGLPLVWVIPSSIYGPGRDDNNVLSYAIKALLKREKPAFTALEQRWDYLYIDDFVDAVALIAEKGITGKDYALGSGIARELREYITTIRDIIDPALPLGIGERPYKGGKPDNSVMDISELARDTGFEPKVSFDEGIGRVIEWFRQ
jgi:nucleoside-diphosphate-sugar epimerase